MKSRIVILFIFITLAFTGLLVRGAYLQLFPHQRLTDLMRKQFQSKVTLQSRRGSIYDRNGRELAVSVTTYSLFADPSLIKNSNSLARKLSKYLKANYYSLRKKLKRRGTRFVWIERQLSQKTKQKIGKLNHPGLGFIEEPKRIYPNKHLASHTLGFIGSSGDGLEGLELALEDKIKGAAEKLFVKRDARGRPLMMDLQSFKPPQDGEDVYTSIDIELQYMLEKVLAQALAEQSAESAVGVILDAKTSEILSAVTLPSFNANKPFNVYPAYRRNRVFVDSFEPGSTLKTIAVAAALEEGVVLPNSKIDCEDGVFKIGRRKIREADSQHNFSELTVSEVLAKSSNIGSSKIALKLGDKKYRQYLEKFGFGQKLPLQFPGVAGGILRPTPWGQHQLANISFGHGITTTPLQVASAYAAIANNGMYRSPTLLKGVLQPEKRVLSDETAHQVKLMLMGATSQSGTGAKARVPGFPVAGKTGTAQKVNLESGGYLKGQYISSFAGFAPANDPKYVIYIAVDNPQKKYYGSEVAAPIFAEVAKYALRKSGTQPILISKGNLLDKKGFEFQAVEKKRDHDKNVRRATGELAKNRLPQMKGMTLRQVMKLSSEIQADVKIKGRGRVQYTVPGAGVALGSDLKELRIILSE